MYFMYINSKLRYKKCQKRFTNIQCRVYVSGHFAIMQQTKCLCNPFTGFDSWLMSRLAKKLSVQGIRTCMRIELKHHEWFQKSSACNYNPSNGSQVGRHKSMERRIIKIYYFWKIARWMILLDFNLPAIDHTILLRNTLVERLPGLNITI